MEGTNIPVQLVAEQVHGLRSEFYDFRSEARKGFRDITDAIAGLSYIPRTEYVADKESQDREIKELKGFRDTCIKIFASQALAIIAAVAVWLITH